ncbi:MAG: cobalamin B12-binding domain-containing protein [Candidatus Geothermincolia bacterium]
MAGAREVERVRNFIIELDDENIGKAVREAVTAGASTRDIVENGMRAGMTEVGRRYEAGEFYLAELEMSAEVMGKGLSVLKSLVPWEAGGGGKIVLATVKGDMHDMGKGLVGNLLTASGYDVMDVGVDASPEDIVEAVRRERPKVLGLSLVLSASRELVDETMDALRAAGLRDAVKVIIGGVAASEEIAGRYGCDAYVGTAFDVVEICNELLKTPAR